MTVNVFLSWVVCGLIAGAIARLIVPGQQNMSLLLTMVLGVVGAIVGGFLFSMVQTPATEPFSLSGNAWHSWVASILGAVLVVFLYAILEARMRQA